MNTYKPVILGFVLSTFSAVAVVFFGMRDELNANNHYHEIGYQYREKFDQHMDDYTDLRLRLASIEQNHEAAVETRRDLKELLKRNEEVLNRVNTTLTETSVTLKKDIESIHKRLDKAGI